ncbi:MAG: protein kinase domain-containing protein [Planctomycetaceae bacterium]
MKPSTADNLLHLAGELELVPAGALHEAFAEAGGHALDAAAFGQTLVRRELLTGFQLERLLRGERGGYSFGRAKILYQIGAGSFARVYRAVHRDTGAVLAVKVLRNRFASEPEKCRAFQHEGEMGRLLRHPNIVAIEDVGQENGASYLTMEFVEGQTLRELVKIRGAVDARTAIDLIHQAVSGLEYAHRRGVTHRDVKASNVIISSTGRAKLVDFGLAGVDDSGDKLLGRVEKPRTIDYVALEKMAGVRDDSVRSDIYFLGTVAYLALAGVAPLTESRDRSIRGDPRRFTQVTPLGQRCPDLPRDVVDVVSRMMHPDPLERYQTATDAKLALESVLARQTSGDAAAATPGGAVARPVATPAAAATKGAVMLVEVGEKAQQTLRDYFAKLGYRVLLTENPQRALVRFSAVPPAADFLVLSGRELGAAAVEAFNALSKEPHLADVPAILLVSPKHPELAATARTDARRKVVPLPLQATELARALGEILKRKA